MPPNGSSASDQSMLLMNIIPVSTRLATRLPRAMSLVKTEPPRPKSEVVGERDRRVLVLDPEEQRHRAEELVAEGRIVRLDVGEDRRLHERAGAIDALAAHHSLAPCGDGAVDLLEKSHQCRFGGQAAERRLLVHRVAGLERRERRLELLQELVGDRVDDDEPLGRAAGLSGVVHPAPDGPFDGVVEVGVFEHDEGVAAAEFHRRNLQILARSRGDALAGGDAAGQAPRP